jgi:hypothetical protein
MKTFTPSAVEEPEKDNNSIQQRDLMKTAISISKGTWKYQFFFISKGPEKISISINKKDLRY